MYRPELKVYEEITPCNQFLLYIVDGNDDIYMNSRIYYQAISKCVSCEWLDLCNTESR